MRPAASLLALVAAAIALALTASAAPAAGPFLLEIEASSGTGYGEVQCKVGTGPAEECEYEYESGTKLTLVPAPEAESEFAGFRNGTGSAAACGGTKPCTFTIKADSYVEAPFDLAYRSLAFALKGEGEGEVSCEVEGGAPEACEDEYLLGTELTLVGEPEAGSEFSGFQAGQGSASGCIGTEPCSFLLQANATLEARFEPVRYLLTVTRAGSGQGAVSCNGKPCLPAYPEGTEVTLTAAPAAGSAFAGFSGEGCSGTGPCVVWVEGADVTVTAGFEVVSPPPDSTSTSSPPVPAKAGMARVSPTATVKGGKAAIRLSCSGGPCQGTLKLTMRVRRGKRAMSVVIARAPFGLQDGEAKTLRVKLSSAAARMPSTAAALRAQATGPGLTGSAVKLKLTAR